MKNLLNKILGEKTKKGKCRFWNHIWEYEPEISFHPTSKYVNGYPIMTKYVRDVKRCTTCNKKEYGDLNFG